MVNSQLSTISDQPSAPYSPEPEAVQGLSPALTAFDAAISAHPTLEIDSDYANAGRGNPAPTPETHDLKVVNHDRRAAYGVSLRAILDYDPRVIIETLETGILNPLYGVTRIVGYYSRIQNWNKSKLGELADRHRGNYRVGTY